MKLLSVAVPLFGPDLDVGAYRLHTQSADNLYGFVHDHAMATDAVSSPHLELLNDIGVEPFTGGKPLFVDINRLQLLAEAPLMCRAPASQLVITIGKDIPCTHDYLAKCRLLKARGYAIALRNYPFKPETESMYRQATYAILDSNDTDYMKNHVEIHKNMPFMQTVFENISRQETFLLIRNRRRSFFEGKFFHQPLMQGKHTITSTKTTAMRLLRMMGDPNFNMDHVANIIKEDPAITLSLFRFINSPAVGVRHRISSIQNAVAILGQRETIRWLAVALSSQLAEDKPNEISRLSLIRAQFAENLAPMFGMAQQADSLFLVGLFSMLDVILQKPMALAVTDIALTDDIARTLVEHTGSYYDVLQFIYTFERADWSTLMMMMMRSDMPAEAVNQAFINALLWYKALLQGMV